MVFSGLGQRVVRDFSRNTWLVRQALGRFLIDRELLMLNRLRGLAGVPAELVRDGPFALSYRFVDGETLSSLRSRRVTLDREFFCALEQLVEELHARGFAHLDLRNGKNILGTTDGRPHLLDFQSGVWIGHVPRLVRRRLEAVDYSGVYKWWGRLAPQQLDGTRRALLQSINRQRRFWPFNYPRSGSAKWRGEQPAHARLN